MISFGSTDNHTNALDFTDLAALDGNVQYMVGLWLKQLATPAAQRTMLSDGVSVFDAGWALQSGDAGTIRIRHNDGAAETAIQVTANLADGVIHSLLWVWTSAVVWHYFDGVFVAQTALTRARNANALAFILGNSTAKNVGYPYQIGHYMYWHNLVQSRAEADLNAAIFHAHQSIPRSDKLTFYYKGTANPGLDEISRTVPTVAGSVSLVGDAVDAYYQTVAQQHLRIASHRLLRRSTEEPRYRLRVPLRFVNVEPMDLTNLSHSDLPLAASRLATLETDQLMKPWQRLIVRAIAKETLYLERAFAFDLKDHESFGCTFWSSDRLPEGTSARFEGLARLDNGSRLVVDRSSAGYLEQPSNVKVEISQETEGGFIRQVDLGLEKMNHVGFLAEDATTNFVLNNCAKDSESGWTSTTNGGTLDLSTLRLAYPSVVTPRSFRAVRTNNSNDTYRKRTFAMLAADGFARAYAVKSEENSTSIAAVRIQRSTDSWYWNDSSGAFQSGSVWIRFANDYDTVKSLVIKKRRYSKPIPISANQNWTIDFGLEGAALPAGGGEVNFYSVSVLKGKLVYSEVPTSNTAMLSTPIADTVYHERTSLPQVFPAARGSLTFELVAIQDEANLTTDDSHCLYYWQAGATAGQNYDAVLYQRLTAETARISFARYVGASLNAKAHFVLNLVAGQVYNVTAVWTDGVNDELGEGNFLMRVIVDSVVGVDAHATATHSATTATTQFWRGSAPGATGYKRGMNYTRNPRLWTRPLPLEEAA